MIGVPDDHSSPYPKRVRLIEVGPRDGLQNESTPVPFDAKLRLLDDLANAGLNYLEAGSFVHPTRVPQMADSDQLFKQLERRTNITYAALTPNLKGLERALAVDADEPVRRSVGNLRKTSTAPSVLNR